MNGQILSGIVALLALFGTAHAEFRVLVHIDATAAKSGNEDWAAQAAAQVARIAAELRTVNRHEEQIFDRRQGATETNSTAWLLEVVLGAKTEEEGDRWHHWQFSSKGDPIDAQALEVEIAQTRTRAQRWHEAYGIPRFALYKMGLPDMVVRLVDAPDRSDPRSGSTLRQQQDSIYLLASSPNGRPSKLRAYTPRAWADIPSLVAAPLVKALTNAIEESLPENWRSCDVPVQGACRLEVLAIGQGAPAEVLVAQGDAALPTTWRRSVGELNLLSIDQVSNLRGLQAASGTQAWCQWKAGPKSRLVVHQLDRLRQDTVHESVVAKVQVLGAECMNVAGIHVQAIQNGEVRSICSLKEAQRDSGCSWKPNSNSDKAVLRVGQASRPLIEKALQIEQPAQVKVALSFFAAACPGADEISPGPTSTFTDVGRLCIGYSLKPIGEGVPPEFGARFAKMIEFGLRFSEKQVATFSGRDGQLTGQAEFAISSDWHGQPLAAEFTAHLSPIRIDDTRYLPVLTGQSKSGTYVLTTYRHLVAAGIAALMLVAVLSFAFIRYFRRRAAAQAHQLNVSFTVPSWPGIQLANVLRWTGRREAHGDLPDVLGLDGLTVERLAGGGYRVHFARSNPGTIQTPSTLDFNADQSQPWGPFQVEVARCQ